jgi:hypothetical protein
MTLPKFNPSTLKLIDKNGRISCTCCGVSYLPGISCDYCDPDGTPECISIAFSGIVNCGPCIPYKYGAITYYGELTPSDIAAIFNQTFILAHQDYGAYQKKCSYLYEQPITDIEYKLYYNSGCTSYYAAPAVLQPHTLVVELDFYNFGGTMYFKVNGRLEADSRTFFIFGAVIQPVDINCFDVSVNNTYTACPIYGNQSHICRDGSAVLLPSAC